jgi:HEAT repeat-containing protein 5
MDPLIGLLVHSNEGVRARAAWTLRCFCYIAPSRLAKVLLHVLELIQRDVSVISTPTAPQDIAVRSLGHAYGLAAVVAVIRERPLYVSYDTSAKILDLSVQLLKRAGTHDTQIAAVEVEIAWTLLASLMTLGPNFVRSQLPQLLVLWRNALPKPTSKDSDGSSGRTASEWMFLLHVRETALGAIYSFLLHNSPALVTLDVARRIASLLTNVLSFANAFVSQKIDVQSSAGGVDASSLLTREAALRRRIYQCFSLLGFSGVADSTQVALMQSAVAQLASPAGYIGSAMQAAIASSAGDLTSLSQCTDGYAYGVTSIRLDNVQSLSRDEIGQDRRERLNRDAVENALDDTVGILSGCMEVNSYHYYSVKCPFYRPWSMMLSLYALQQPLRQSYDMLKVRLRQPVSLMPQFGYTGLCSQVKPLPHVIAFSSNK